MKVAVVGLGGRGRAFVRTLTNLGIPPAGVVDHHAERQAAAVAAGAADSAAVLDDLLGRATFDLVIVATPPADHVATAELALAFGSAVLVEKPVAVAPDDVRPLLPHTARVGVAHSERWNPAVVALGDVLRAGALGTVHRASFDRHGPAPAAPGVGVDADLAVHDVDLAHWLLGPLSVLERETAGGRRPDRVRIRATAESVEVEVRASWTPEVRRRIEIEGSDGTAVADLHAGAAWLVDPARSRRPLPTGARRPLEGLLEAVLTAVAAGEPLPVPLVDAVDALAVAVGAGHRPSSRRTLL